MEQIQIREGWQLACTVEQAGDWQALNALFSDQKNVYALPGFPMQVHDVLLDAGVIENPNVRGVNHDLWIHEKNWVYRCFFPAKPGLQSLLRFGGLDTFADVWLNGSLIGSANDVYLSWTWDVTEQLRENNCLIVFFHAAKPVVDAFRLPETYQGLVPAISALRVFRTGFHDYCGPSPCLIRCGIYDRVTLMQAEPVMLVSSAAECSLDGDGRVRLDMTWQGDTSGLQVALRVEDADGCVCASGQYAMEADMRVLLTVPAPRRWYPWTHGEPYLYTLVLDAPGVHRETRIGFRTVTVDGDMRFTVNGQPFRPWGANLMHLDTLSGCYDDARMERMLQLAKMANCNMLRVWGEADRLPQAFYDRCDRMGLLVWQDFFLGCSLYSEEEDFTTLCMREAREMVLALRHHPCIALWCGGNELYLARDYQHPGAPVYGERLVTQLFPAVCAELDPTRYYHASSPCGGAWANDPSSGDTHGYTHLWFVPGRAYPAFLSENCRVSTPTLRSMKRMMTPQELWPQGYHGALTRTNRFEWPEAWNRHTPNEGWRKLGPVEHYPDAETPAEMVYRVCMAHAEYIRNQVSRFRRGRARGSDHRRTGGHLLWRLNDNSNVISFGVVDYFLQPGHAYYEMKRCYQPLFVSCELADTANIWLVNDTPMDFDGSVEVFLFHLVHNRVTASKRLPVSVASGESLVVCDLNDFGQFRKENMVCMRVFDASGTMICEAFQPCDIERRLPYPEDSGIRIRASEDGVVVSTQRYAHCVELEGDTRGDSFPWLFEDNFFDLLPGCEREIRILRGSGTGEIRARAAYDREEARCRYEWRD